MVMEVHDNWYATRVATSGRLLAVGTWLPPEGIEGIVTERVEAVEARGMLVELEQRSRGPSLVGRLYGRG
jgi:hypothetical protein